MQHCTTYSVIAVRRVDVDAECDEDDDDSLQQIDINHKSLISYQNKTTVYFRCTPLCSIWTIIIHRVRKERCHYIFTARVAKMYRFWLVCACVCVCPGAKN